VKLSTLRENFVKIVQGLCEAFIFLKFGKNVKFSVFEPHAHPCTDGREFSVDSCTPNLTPIGAAVACAVRKTLKSLFE